MTIRALAPIAAAVAALALSAGPAAASEVHLTQDYQKLGGNVPLVAVDAAPGEANDVSVILHAGATTVVDATAPLSAGEGCTPNGEHEAVCASGTIVGYSIHLGDGDDSLAIGGDGSNALPAYVSALSGGDGRDSIVGGVESDQVLGGRGVDFALAGGGGGVGGGGGEHDSLASVGTVIGGGGNDRLLGDGLGDTLVG